MPGKRGTPPRHVQFLHQLPGLLLRLQPVQGRALKSRQDQKVLSDFLRGFRHISRYNLQFKIVMTQSSSFSSAGFRSDQIKRSSLTFNQ